MEASSREGRTMAGNWQGQGSPSVSSRFGKGCVSGLVLSLALLGPLPLPQVHAASLIVNTDRDLRDAKPGDGVCDAAPPDRVCTLRAAIQEANMLPGAHEIILPPNTYLLTILAELPAIT